MFICSGTSSIHVYKHKTEEWRIFIDFSKGNLKAVRFHNGSKFISTHAANMKETYESMKLPLDKIKFEEYKWNVRGDSKVIIFAGAKTWFP